MERRAVLAAFDEQIRRRPGTDAPDSHVERDGGVVRSISDGDGWSGVTWCALDELSADAVIAAQISRFAEMSRPWEWKHYSYDQPPDLPDRLLAAGFTPEPAEALLVAEIADLTLDVPAAAGCRTPRRDRRARCRRARSRTQRGVRHRPLRLGQGLARRPRPPAGQDRGGRGVGRGYPSLLGACGFSLRHGLRQPLGRRYVDRLAAPRRVSLARSPPGRPRSGSRLPVPPGRCVSGQPTDPPATWLRRARDDDPVHARRRALAPIRHAAAQSPVGLTPAASTRRSPFAPARECGAPRSEAPLAGGGRARPSRSSSSIRACLRAPGRTHPGHRACAEWKSPSITPRRTTAWLTVAKVSLNQRHARPPPPGYRSARAGRTRQPSASSMCAPASRRARGTARAPGSTTATPTAAPAKDRMV